MLVGIPPYYDDNIKVLYHNIERGKLKMPRYLSPEAKKFLMVSLTFYKSLAHFEQRPKEATDYS